MVPEEKKEDYIMDTLEIIQRCLKGKMDYFGVALYAEAHKPAPCDCKEPTQEDSCIPVYEYDIYMEIDSETPKEKIKVLNPISTKTEREFRVLRLLLLRVLSTNNNMEIVENSNEASTITHLSLEQYISLYLNGILREFTGREF